MIHDLLLGPSQVEVTFIHIQIPIFGKIFQQRVSPHALLTKAFTYSFEGRVALWSRVASMCSLVSDGDFVGQNVPREMFTHNKQLNWNVSFKMFIWDTYFSTMPLPNFIFLRNRRTVNTLRPSIICVVFSSGLKKETSEQFRHGSLMNRPRKRYKHLSRMVLTNLNGFVALIHNILATWRWRI